MMTPQKFHLSQFVRFD